MFPLYYRYGDISETDAPLTASTIRPESIPINIKVIVVATHDDLRALRYSDEEFDSYFKVMAEFDYTMARTPENIQKYVSFVAETVRNSGLRPFDKTAVARLIDCSSRFAGDQNKLTTIFQTIVDVIAEANHWASLRKHTTVTREDVEKTIEQREYRDGLSKNLDQKEVEDGYIHITTKGKVVGQINGLTVIDNRYGSARRITAKVSLGRGQLISVEREAKLTGEHHYKGFLVLKGYLNGKYGQDKPLSLSASFSFEQFHGFLDGDSASSSEVYALLSELSGIPLSQSIAATGSVNQNGDVQAIGGPSYKVEGFFDLCAAKGLDGNHGVIVPKDNLKNLVLKKEVVQAVRDGLFHIYGVSTIDEGIEVLTGIPAGQVGKNGIYPKGSVHQLVENRLDRMARLAREWELGNDIEDETSNDEIT